MKTVRRADAGSREVSAALRTSLKIVMYQKELYVIILAERGKKDMNKMSSEYFF